MGCHWRARRGRHTGCLERHTDEAQAETRTVYSQASARLANSARHRAISDRISSANLVSPLSPLATSPPHPSPALLHLESSSTRASPCSNLGRVAF